MNTEFQLTDVRSWVSRLSGPGTNREDGDQAIATMRALGPERLTTILQQLLGDPDSEFRCNVALAIVHVDPINAALILLPLLDDPDELIRWQACGLLHDLADKRAVEPLIRIMKADADPQVRNTAAYALGGIGDPSAIPALIETLDHDHEFDELGYSASGCAATALDDILRTNHTRLKRPDGLCTMLPTPLDLESLKRDALELHRQTLNCD